MFKRIDHTAFIVRDRETSIDFYQNILGFHKYFEHDVPFEAVKKIVYLKLGDTVLELIHVPEGPLDANQAFHFCLESDDFQRDYDFLVQSKVRVDTPPHLAGGRVKGEENWQRAVFTGPDGEAIEIRG